MNMRNSTQVRPFGFKNVIAKYLVVMIHMNTTIMSPPLSSPLSQIALTALAGGGGVHLTWRWSFNVIPNRLNAGESDPLLRSTKRKLCLSAHCESTTTANSMQLHMTGPCVHRVRSFCVRSMHVVALDVWGELTGHERSLTHHPWFSRPGHPVCLSHRCMRPIYPLICSNYKGLLPALNPRPSILLYFPTER